MSERKTPILLRKGPMSGRIEAIYRYSRKIVRGRDVIVAHGKQDVTADFDVLLLQELIPDAESSIVAELDGAARGIALNEEERAVVRDFRERLVVVIDRHNARSADG